MESETRVGALELRVVNNGYWVAPGYSERTHGNILPPESVHVFESFEALIEWLKNNLKKPNVLA